MERFSCQLAGACLVAVAMATTLAAETATNDTIEEIREYLERLEKLGFAGSVVLAQKGAPLLAQGYGLADRERGIPWTPATVSTIGSITKQFTGAAILTLVEDGLVAVDDPITRYFEVVPEDKRAITVHQLLTHTSGIVDLEGLGDWDPIERDEFVRRALAQDLEFAPGERHEYSNAGYSLLGAILEKVTGKSYEEYLRQRLFLPAGMYDTGYILAPWGESRLAQGYRRGERWGTVVERPFADDGPFWVLRANGGIHSTAWDMLRWGQALLDGEPLSADSMATYWTPHVDEGGGDSFYGYGWVVMEAGDARVITHNGGNAFLFADMGLVPAVKSVAVIQTNVIADFPLANRLLEQIGGRLLRAAPLPDVPDWDRDRDANLESLAGTYALERGGELQVTLGDDELAIEAGDVRAFQELLSLRPVDSARAERLSAAIDAIVGDYLGGDWRPLWEAYDRFAPFDEFAPRAQGRLDALLEEHGALRGHEVLGTAFRERRDVTLVRLLFERGHEDRAYVWDAEARERLLGTSRRGLDPVLHVLPEVDGSFTSWDGRSGATRPVSFETSEGVLRLVIGDDPRVVAVRKAEGYRR